MTFTASTNLHSNAHLPADTQTSTPAFRLAASRLWLTYPQIGSNPALINLQDLLTQLQQKLTSYAIAEYALIIEHHKDGNLHLHVYLAFNQRFFTRDPHRLDLSINDNVFHGNYQSCKTRRLVLSYIAKTGHDNVFTNIPRDDFSPASNKGNINVWTKAIEIAETGDVSAALALLKHACAKDYIAHLHTYKRSLCAIRDDARRASGRAMEIFPLDQFVVPPEVSH